MRPNYGQFILLVALWCGVSFIAASAFGTAGALCIQIGGIIVAFAILPQISKNLRLNQRKEAPPATDVLEKDKRPPVIYLRSFKEEGSRKEVPAWTFMTPFTNFMGFINTEMPTFEQELAAYIETAGPFITFANKKYGPPELGAARVYAEDDNWRELVEDLLGRCQFIVFRAGETESLLWELARIVQIVPAEKVFVYLQIGAEHDMAVQQARYKKFRTLAEPILPKPLPETKGKNDFLHFAPDWTPILSKNIRTVLIEKDVIFEHSPLRYSLKKLLPYASVDVELYRYSWPSLHISQRLALKRGAQAKEPNTEHIAFTASLPEKSFLFPNQGQNHSIFYAQYFRRVAALVTLGCFIALLFGGLYGFLDSINPLPLLNFVPFFTAASIVAVFIGLLGRYIVLPGSRMYVLTGLLAGLLFIYSKWMMMSSSINYGLTLNPTNIFYTMADLAAYQAYMTSDSVYLWSLWILEAAIAIFVVSLLAWVYGLSNYEYTQATTSRVSKA